MGRPKASQSNGPSNAPKFEQRIRFGNYHLDLVKHPENVCAVHLCIDRITSMAIALVIYLCLLTRGHIL